MQASFCDLHSAVVYS